MTVILKLLESYLLQPLQYKLKTFKIKKPWTNFKFIYIFSTLGIVWRKKIIA